MDSSHNRRDGDQNKLRGDGAKSPVKLPVLKGQQAGSGTNGVNTLSGTTLRSSLPPLVSLPSLEEPKRLGSAILAGEGQQTSLMTMMNVIEPEFRNRIFTGMDIISYYATFGHSAKIKMFHCIRANLTGTDCPYELVMVPKETIRGDYYTMTASGVVQMFQSGAPAEFTPIGEWVREHSVFNMMKQLRFFRNYMALRYLQNWRKAAKAQAFDKVCKILEGRLLMAKPDFCFSIMEIQTKLYDLKQIKLIEVNPKPPTLNDFSREQEDVRKNRALPSIASSVQGIERSVLRLIGDVRKAEANLRRDVDDLERESNPMLVAAANSAGAKALGKSSNKSLVRIKQEKLEKIKALRMAVQDAGLLPNVVRLVDYLLVEGALGMLVSTIDKFRIVMDTQPVICVQLSFAEKGMNFNASEEEARQMIAMEMIDALLQMVRAFPRILSNEAFKQMVDGIKGQDMTQLILGYKPLNKARINCSSAIAKSYRDAHDSVERYEELRAINDFCVNFDAYVYQQADRDVAQFRRDMVLLKSWMDDLTALQAGEAVGMLHVSCTDMQTMLMGTLDKAMDSLKMLLTVAAHKEVGRVLDMFSGLTTNMQARPQKLDEFSNFYAQFVENQAKREALDKSHSTVLAMYDMLQEYGGKIPPSDVVSLDDLKEAVGAYNRSITDAQAYVDERKAGMSTNLATSVKETLDTLQEVIAELRSGKFDNGNADTDSIIVLLGQATSKYETVAERATRFKGYEELFGQPASNFGDVDQALRELTVHNNKWQYLKDFEVSKKQWTSMRCEALSPDAVQAKMDDLIKKNYKMVKNRKDDEVVLRLKKELDAFMVFMPLLQEVSNPALESRHWEQVFKVLGQPYTEGQFFSLSELIKYNIMDNFEQLQNIGAMASKEYSMLKAMEKMEAEWGGLEFKVMPYKDTGTYIIGGTDEVQTILDDQIVKIQAMNASPFVKPFKERATAWEATLQTLQDMLDNWLQCQSTWLYLEPIFSSDDIVKQMPEEGEKFRAVDAMWREMMKSTHSAPAVIPIAREKERVDKLVECNSLLDAIQKGLAAYLEKKRLFFPRFFFLSNDEMLEILSETKDPTRCQPHLKKCFEGINTLEFDDNYVIHAMNSVEKERVQYKHIIDTNKARGSVEKWLLEVEGGMFDAIHDVTGRGIIAYAQKPRSEWVLEWPGMVVLVVTAVYWTKGVTAAIKSSAVAEYEKQCTSDLLRIVDLVRGELTGLQRATLGALVVMDVHARDVVTVLATKGVHSDTDFEWQAQLRSYWEEDPNGERDQTVMMRMMSATIQYGYEYLGNSSRLVITPLTDRCYRTLMGAIHLTLGGAPEGPAGTGKTETTKDLAKALARQCVVFNCSDSLDYLAMAKFFKGLASSGAWACFDEFNRINLEVLSVVAQQVLDIQRAVAARLKQFVFEGTEMQLKWSAWCSITMNPGYAGRSELPDNLKALFRTVAMMVPDYAMISEIILYSNGYLAARECAKKIVQCYKLCSEQLSSQDHYDYGMRAVIAVLRAAGNLKRRFPQEDELVLMLRSIIDVNLCKFLSHDVPLFQGIISDLFPGVVLPKPDYQNMEKAMQDACAKMNLQPTDYFILKTIQLYEMIVVRHGLMIVGLPFSGKTTSYRVLADALTLMEERGEEGQSKAEYFVINPKSVTMGQLYGQFDPVTHEWTDGILAVTFRAVASNPAPHRKWLLLDGPVDAIWIENMNTVLDDNKKLCLNSGEIISMSASMNMIFEVADLAVASPATVSRCGMVYLEPHQLGWRPLVLSWLNTFPPHFPNEERQHLLGLFDWLVPVSLRFVRRDLKEAAPTLDGQLVTALMRNFTALTMHLTEEDQVKELGQERLRIHVESIFVFSLVWSIGCSCATNETRIYFDAFIRAAASSSLPNYVSPSGEKYTLPEDIPEGHVTLSSPFIPSDKGALVYDFVFEAGSDKWVSWFGMIDDSPIPSDAKFRKIIIPTMDTVRYTYLLDKAIKNNSPMLVVGPTGTGKSVLVQKYLYSLPNESYVPPNVIGFSARATANMAQYLIDAKLDRRRKGVFGPPSGKKAIIFVDDLNMPQLETYGAQPPIELLRQYMDHGGWYDRQNLFRRMDDCLFVTAMGPPGGGRNNVTSRYTRHFNMLSIVDFDDSTLKRIFSTILDWALKSADFSPNIKELRDCVVSGTLDVYQKVISSLLPTPTKSHYTFNLRDISRVMQGFLLIKPTKLRAGQMGKEKYVRLWVHEIFRVFYDRLVDRKDRTWFLDFMKQTVQSRFEMDFDKIFKHLLADSSDGPEVNIDHVRSCFFGDYMDASSEEAVQRAYDEVTDPHELMSRMEEYLMDHNAMSKRPMNLAVFLYAVEHVSRIARVLKQPGAHMLCVGVGGSGRQSLSRLAAFISGMQTFQIEISKSYTQTEWREDLKKFTRMAGGQGQPCVFLFSDSQIKQESFVEDINNLLNSGEVPNMFPYDERAAVLEQCRQLSKKEGLDLDSAVDLWNYFVDKTRENLHVVLCFSPIGNAFRERLRQFPSLVNCCTIDWFSEWPNDALEAVALKFLKDLDVPPTQRTNIMSMCKMFHENVRQLSEQYLKEAGRINYVTPTSYLELITAFTTLLAAKRAEVMAAKKRYEVGLEKLEFTGQQVVIMQEELTALKPNLIRTVAETERLMATVKKEKTEVVEPKKAIVDEDVKTAEEAANAANAIKMECEEALAEAIPILNSAIAALDTIKPADIKLVQSFKSPPATIKVVMEAVCVLLDVKAARVKDPGGSGKMIEDYWPSATKVLADPNFVKTLKDYDKDNVKPAIIDRIRKEYTCNADFTPANAAKASSAAEGLCKWVCAMDSYDKVAKVVAPKKAALAEAEGTYNTVMTALNIKQADLKELMDKLADLEAQLEHSVSEKSRLEGEVELCTQKLERAEKLIQGLGGEKTRWTEAAAALGGKYQNLTGDMLISAGVISYLGAFTMAYRDQVVGRWVAGLETFGIPRSGKFSLVASLGDPVKIREWGIAGLPNDSFSTDNGIMVANARRWPLMIDPQTQANKWIKNMEHDLRVIKLTDGDYMRTLENAIQFGIPVLLENVGEELDPSLEPLLLKQLFKQGGVNYIRLGDATIEFSDQFRFYITTALRNPHYLPETAVKVTLLNFMITLDGLSDQLLGVTVAQERPDLEAQRQQLVVESAENKKKLKEIEDKILHVLSSSQGNILEDASAIQILSEAKVVSNDIQMKEVVAEQTQAEIDEARTGYKPGGAYNAILFFCIRDMAGIDPMYQYSLAWFISLFIRSIQSSTKSEDVGERLKNINDHFTYALYQNICRSLFEKDKLLFAFLLTARIMLGQSELDPNQYQFLLTGGVGIHEKEVQRPLQADWLSQKAWGEICRAPGISHNFATLPEDVAGNLDLWRHIFDAVQPQNSRLPLGYNEKLTPFEKVLVLRMFRPDKVVPSIQGFVTATLGVKFTEPPPFDLAGSYKESSCTSPLLFVLSAGSDPTAALLQFADTMGYGSKISVISMGQGQGPKAATLIQAARKAGSWVLLQNCHLAPSWMPSLEKICENIKPDNTDNDFRLWMTSMPSPDFPVSILQNGVKMTNEPPAGLRANLKRSFALEPISSPEFFEGCSKPKAFKSLLFGLCFLHAFVQERRKFGPIGWNIPYGFDDGDLRISVRQLRMYIDDNAEIPYDALKYAIGECNYGGRVTDDKDRRLLNTMLARIYRPEIMTEEVFKLSASGTYYTPPEGPHSSYITYINSLPTFPLPEAFGLHENADITKDLQQTEGMLDTLILTGGAGGGGEGGSSEELVGAMVTDILSRLPANFDIEKAQHKYPVRYEQSLNQVLCQEMLRYNRLLSVIRGSLINLDKAVQGLQVMSSELDAVFRSMAVGQVPALWKGSVSFPSLKPLASYTVDLLARLNMLQTWYEEGAPSVFWISGFFFTPSFTTAALQNYARKHKLPIDTVGFDFVMMGTDPNEYKNGPEDGIYIHGLYLEGCAWDGGKRQLKESNPKVLSESAPVIWLQPKTLDKFSAYPAYECPVYRTAERRGVLATTGHNSNFLMFIRMPTDMPDYHWVNRGVCMLCSLSD
ncbi:hypothetical protein CEUSTIGMA_g1654.t1 [Chlamydomonas eustigma]|uniref:AAA+ ATPase domain-containing protein n=1 Tax=Chlamydomonas eustigma TaxID=1157962 RepID=A0A250WTS2_9CHLO|nr:hypothetical protein CEUSTIGMA_g1654.t1 [Chlamydomonas eustigma]|eukprot:GAX74205.1 hypothetical protein CEUSTIGMA_g1654.t1 [Chlamydomonas eustigma]